MDKTGKFVLPSPKFEKLDKSPARTSHYLTAYGMLLPKEKQPPPMYGPRGATVPPAFLNPQKVPPTSTQTEKPQKFYCEPCEAEFHTSTDYRVHKSEHTQCEIDNCSFTGHPSFMDTHIAQQHATGLYDQIKRLSTPEEIAQWRADRKKNYPTVASVLQKWKAREQKKLRGEKLEKSKSRFGQPSDRRPIRTEKEREEIVEKVNNPERPEWNRQRRKRNCDGKQNVPKTEKKEAPEPVSVKAVENVKPTHGGFRMFKGTANVPGYQRTKKVEKHALSSLLGMYGSDSEEDDSDDNDGSAEPEPQQSREEPVPEHTDVNVSDNEDLLEAEVEENAEPNNEEVENSESLPTTSQEETDETKNASDPTEKCQSDDEDAPEEAPVERSTTIPDRPQPEIQRKKPKQEPPKRKTQRSGLDYRKLRQPRQNTMLEKLLESDIVHERNVLLQCVRFVVENKFFGVGAASSSQS